MRPALVATVAVLSAFACSNPTAPTPRADVSARVTRQEPSATGGFALTIAVTVKNTTAESIYFDFCGSTIERQNAARGWESVGGILCNAIGCPNPLHCMVRIRAGESWEYPLHFYAYGGISVGEPGSSHRLRLSIATPVPPNSWPARVGHTIARQSLTTNEFALAPS